MKNNTFVTTLGIMGGAAFLAAAPVKAGTPVAPVTPAPVPSSIGAEVSLGYDTHYIFRGFNYGENLVWAGVDLGVPLTEGLSLNLGSWYGTLAEDSYDELNLLAGLSYDLGAFEIGVGAIWYYYPQGFDGGGLGIDDSLELGASIGTNFMGLDLGLGYYYDLEEEGSYIELGAEKAIEISDSVALVAGTSVGYARDYYGVDGFNAVGASLSLPIALGDRTTLKPYIAATWEIDESGQDDEVYGGVSLSVSF
ncbi:MAG: hypothetical protein ACI8XO_000250 [Verrucomicrobiales bacterium]|jgi:hypothetical protein